jgi:glutamate dehydrogenase
MLREEGRFRARIGTLPAKCLYAIIAAEIASSLVYHGDRETDFEEMLRGHLTRNFSHMAYLEHSSMT